MSKLPRGFAATIILLAFLLLGGGVAIAFTRSQRLTPSPKTYEECLKSEGSTIQESYPQTCVTRSGVRFTQPSELSLVDFCAKGNYETVKVCGGFVIATRGCCDQPGDILSITGEELASCGGLIGPTPPPSCIKFRELQGRIDFSSCREIVCNLSLKPSPPPSAQPPAKAQCKSPRPVVCTQECIDPPPYLCGSNGRSYCTACQACADPAVQWYSYQEKEPCSISPSEESATGSLKVAITTGPTCLNSKENSQKSCTKPYASRAVNIYTSKNTLVSTRTTDKNGEFSLSLPAGEYYLKSATNQIIGSLDQTPFTILSGQATTLNLDVDTGIR